MTDHRKRRIKALAADEADWWEEREGREHYWVKVARADAALLRARSEGHPISTVKEP